MDARSATTLTEKVRHGMATYRTMEEAARHVGIGQISYARIRKVLSIRDKFPLTDAEKAQVDDVLHRIDESNTLDPIMRELDGLIRKYVPPNKAAGKTSLEKHQQAVKKRQQRFDSTLFHIREACSNNEELVIPPLSPEDKGRALETLMDSMKMVCDLMQKVREEDQS
jgi:hypothetical protein